MMRKLAWILSICLLLPATTTLAKKKKKKHKPAVHVLNCGGIERWAVKTASDPNVKNKIRITDPDTISIAAFVHRKRPAHVGPSLARQTKFDSAGGRPVESTFWISLEVHLVEFKMEADSDIHLVVSDPSTHDLLTVEFPNPDCKGAAMSPFRARMVAARNALIAKHGYPPKSAYKAITGTAIVGGIGFFDKVHGSHGSPTEYHPALLFEQP